MCDPDGVVYSVYNVWGYKHLNPLGSLLPQVVCSSPTALCSSGFAGEEYL